MTFDLDDAQKVVPPTLTVKKYAELFNARDWDGVRAMLLDDVRLEVVDAIKRTGREKVGIYFTNYQRLSDWHMLPARLEGREGLAMLRHAADTQVRSFIELTVDSGRIAGIRDFYHVPYFVNEARVSTGIR